MKIVEAGATENNDLARLAYDREPGTRWTSGTAQHPTMAFWVVLDAPAMIGGVTVTTEDPTDNPRQWTVSVMDSTGGHGRKEIAKGEGEIRLAFPAVRGQVIRIEQTGSDPEMWWSIHQFTVTGETIGTEPPPVEPPPATPPVVPMDPSGYTETQARAQAEAWGRLYPDWGIYHDERRSMDGTLLAITAHITFPLVRSRVLEDGTRVVEPWPFSEMTP